VKLNYRRCEFELQQRSAQQPGVNTYMASPAHKLALDGPTTICDFAGQTKGRRDLTESCTRPGYICDHSRDVSLN